MKPSDIEHNWQSLSKLKTLSKLNSSDDGLSASQAKQALATFGQNKLPEAKPTSIVMLFLRQYQLYNKHKHGELFGALTTNDDWADSHYIVCLWP